VSRIYVRTIPIALAASALALLGTGKLPAAAATAQKAARADAPPPSTAPAPDGAAAGGDVIIILKNQHDDLKLKAQGAARRAATEADQAPIVASIEASGGTGITQLVSLNAVAATVSGGEVTALRQDPAVAQVVPDAVVQVPTATSVPAVPGGAPLNKALCPKDPSDPLLEPEALGVMHYETDNPNAPGMAYKLADGSGVIVAIDGMNSLAGNPDLIRPDGSHVVIDSPTPDADASNDEAYGDATSVAGQGDVVYDYSKELPFSGLPTDCTFVMKGDAPGATLIDASLVDTPTAVNPDGYADEDEAQIIAGIDNAVITEHADVISESYGFTQRPGRYAAFYAADDAAVAAGVTVVVSSGDSGDSGTVSSPATDPNVIAAGATNTLRIEAQAYGFTNWTDNNITPLSSGGTTPNNKLADLVAPGYGGEAECNPAGSGCPTNTTTEAFGGTSESAPLIAGAAADVIQAYAATHGASLPTPAQVKEILTSTAEDIDAPADQQGAGLVDIYAAVKAAQQMPGSTLTTAKPGGIFAGPGAASLLASPTQLDLTGNGGSVGKQDVTLYNTSDGPAFVTGRYRSLSSPVQIGTTIVEPVSAPDPSLPVPADGATAASPITFAVPPGLSRLDADMIVPDPQNGTILSYELIAPHDNLTQISYDYGTPSTRAGRLGSTPNIQHVEVADPTPGYWTAKILWANGRSHLQSPPNVPGTFTGNISFRVTGQHFIDRPATLFPTYIAPHSSATVPLEIAMPATPGDHPESVQFTATNGATTSLPVARRTLIPSAGGTFSSLITSSVGRGVGQISTYDITVPAGENDIDVSFSTPDASADNDYTYWLINPSGTVVTEDATPTTTMVGSATPVALADLVALDPVPGTWEIDVELNLTVSGLEFRQVVTGTVAFNQVQPVTESGLPAAPSTTLAAGTSYPASVTVTNTASVGRTFTVRSATGDITGITPAYIPSGGTATIAFSITPTATPGTVVTGTLTVTSNTSVTNQADTFASLPYTYTAG
jgi:hypothetical protein